MKRDWTSVMAEIGRGQGPALLLLFGDDFQVQQACQSVIDLLVPQAQRGFNLERFDGRAAPWERIEATLMTPPFLPGKKIVWVENAPYFLSREQKGELTEKLLQLWRDGKKKEAGKFLLDLLAVEGWTQERWEQLRSAAPLIDLLGDEDRAVHDEVAGLWTYCQENGLSPGAQPGADGNGIAGLCERGMPPWAFLLLTAQQVDRRTRLFKKVEEMGAAFFLDLERDRSGRVSKEKLTAFVQQWLREAGKTMEPQAKEMILDRAGETLRGLQQEVEKLILYVGTEPVIRVEDVAVSFADQGGGWIFDLTRAIAERDAKGALCHLRRLLSQGDHPLKLLGTVASEIRRLLAARQLIDGELRTRWQPRMTYQQFQQSVCLDGTAPLTRNPYADFMCLQRAVCFSLAELRSYMSAIHETDFQLKSSGNQPRLVLEKLILNLCVGVRGHPPTTGRSAQA